MVFYIHIKKNILIGILVVVIIVLGFFVWSVNKKAYVDDRVQIMYSPSPEVSKQKTKTYTDPMRGFSFDYSEKYTITGTDIKYERYTGQISFSVTEKSRYHIGLGQMGGGMIIFDFNSMEDEEREKFRYGTTATGLPVYHLTYSGSTTGIFVVLVRDNVVAFNLEMRDQPTWTGFESLQRDMIDMALSVR